MGIPFYHLRFYQSGFNQSCIPTGHFSSMLDRRRSRVAAAWSLLQLLTGDDLFTGDKLPTADSHIHGSTEFLCGCKIMLFLLKKRETAKRNYYFNASWLILLLNLSNTWKYYLNKQNIVNQHFTTSLMTTDNIFQCIKSNTWKYYLTKQKQYDSTQFLWWP